MRRIGISGVSVCGVSMSDGRVVVGTGGTGAV